MTEKIDLRRRDDNDYPPEIAQLIAKFDGAVGMAEAAAKVSTGYFGRVRRGNQFTDVIKSRVVAALNDEPVERPAVEKQNSLDLPETCPPLLIDLIKTKGSKKAAMATLGTSDGMFYAVMRGQREMPGAWIVRAKAALGLPVIGANVPQPDAPAGPSIPDFVMWDGKSKGTYTTSPKGAHKQRTIKNVPKPLVDLVAKFGNSAVAAANAVGLAAGNSLVMWMEHPESFTELKQRKVHAALHGAPPPGSPSMNEDYDKYEMSLAITMVSSASFDRVQEIADILNGKIIFKKNTKSGWIIIYRMAPEDLPKFKKLAMRDASEIVCP